MKLNKKQIKAIETLEAIGQPNEKEGIKWTQRFMDAFDKKEFEKYQLDQEKLAKNRMTKKRYYQILAGMLNEMLQEMDTPSNKWRSLAYTTTKGVVCQIKDSLGRVYQKAFTPCGVPKVDLQMINRYLGQAEDTMYKYDEKTDSGIYLK